MRFRPVLPHLPHGRAAFTLLEISMLMIAMWLTMVLFAITLSGALKIDRASETALQRLTTQAALADRFRADVARALAVPKQWNDATAGPTCLILRMADGRHVLYRWEKDQLLRAESKDNKTHEREIPLESSKVTVEFGRTDQNERVLLLRLIESRGHGRRPGLEIAATLGGDRL